MSEIEYGVVPRTTIEEVVDYRNKAVQMYADAWKLLNVANQAVEAAHEMARRFTPSINSYNAAHEAEVKEFREALKLPDEEKYTRVARKLCDVQAWAWIVERTDLERLMDKQAKDELRAQMRYIPDRVDPYTKQVITDAESAEGLPPLTVENVYSTMQRFMADANTIFMRGIANAFSKLDRRFKSHDGFKVGSRVILFRAFNESGGWSYYNNHKDTIIDVERAFSILDGNVDGSFTEAAEAVNTYFFRCFKPRQGEIETRYFKIRTFKNGNAHLWFTRDDLVERVNQLLANFYGATLGDKTPDEDTTTDPKTSIAKRFGFFPTPSPAVEIALRDFPLGAKDGRRLRVLEPSAGTGNLAIYCAKQAVVDCVEVQPHLADDLRRSGFFNRVYPLDFLRMGPADTGLYDRVVMNPPFDRERDIDHVLHALRFLKPDGMLMAIMSAGTEFRETRKSRAFRKLLAEKGATFIDLPAGSFSSVGTWCNTIAVTVRNNGTPQHWNSGRTFREDYEE